MGKRVTTSISTKVQVKQTITLLKYVVAGTLVFTVLGAFVFLYLNLAESDDAAARSHQAFSTTGLIDLSHLSPEEMQLLTNRDFENDTIQKDYTSVKWKLNKSLSHLTLEINNNEHVYSLELFDKNGSRVLHFANLTDEKVFVDKFELIPNHEYNYLVRNDIGEMHAGNLQFN